jgi:hypothetical protein
MLLMMATIRIVILMKNRHHGRHHDDRHHDDRHHDDNYRDLTGNNAHLASIKTIILSW